MLDEQQVKDALRQTSITPYLVAIVVMAAITIVPIVAIAIARPGADNSSLYVMIIGFSTSTTAAILALMKSQETHLSVNSRLEQFIRNADRAARSEGELVGRAAGRASAEARTDVLSDKLLPPPGGQQ